MSSYIIYNVYEYSKAVLEPARPYSEHLWCVIIVEIRNQ